MYKLQLRVKDCTSCGVCMDVCPPRAISMRGRSARTVEGSFLAFQYLGGVDHWHPGLLMTYPYLARPDSCDGCGLCVRECPGQALDLLAERSPVQVAAR